MTTVTEYPNLDNISTSDLQSMLETLASKGYAVNIDHECREYMIKEYAMFLDTIQENINREIPNHKQIKDNTNELLIKLAVERGYTHNEATTLVKMYQRSVLSLGFNVAYNRFLKRLES